MPYQCWNHFHRISLRVAYTLFESKICAPSGQQRRHTVYTLWCAGAFKPIDDGNGGDDDRVFVCKYRSEICLSLSFMLCFFDTFNARKKWIFASTNTRAMCSNDKGHLTDIVISQHVNKTCGVFAIAFFCVWFVADACKCVLHTQAHVVLTIPITFGTVKKILWKTNKAYYFPRKTSSSLVCLNAWILVFFSFWFIYSSNRYVIFVVLI